MASTGRFAFLNSTRVSCSSGSLKEVRMTCAPCSANARASVFPRPRLLPVMQTTWSSTENKLVGLSISRVLSRQINHLPDFRGRKFVLIDFPVESGGKDAAVLFYLHPDSVVAGPGETVGEGHHIVHRHPAGRVHNGHIHL